MKLLSLLHRWTGGIVGLLLAVIGLSGTVLLWEGSWISLMGANDPATGDPRELGQAISVALDNGPDLSRITFAGEEIGLHQAIYADGSGAYIAQDGTVVERWSSLWERPELWLFDLHHYLLMGDAGKTVTGVLGILLLLFSGTGFVLWWRTRRTFRFRLWPARFTASAIVRHHRDLGAVASPLLMLAAVTGSLMVFPSASAFILSPLTNASEGPTLPEDLQSADAETDWQDVMASAGSVFPGAVPRRLMIPSSSGEPIAIRYRQDFEWTPNGRSYVWVDPANADVLASDDPARGDAASAVIEKFYPIHAAKVGGWAWRAVMTFAGLAMVILGLLGSWSFWKTQLGDGRLKSRQRLRSRAFSQ